MRLFLCSLIKLKHYKNLSYFKAAKKRAMKKILSLLSIVLCLFIVSCSATKSNETNKSNLKESLDKKNRANVSLLTQIRQKPGIVLKNGVPVLQKTANSISPFGTSEPLYVLDDLIVGNSFSAVNDLVTNFMVKKIEVLSASDASFYGSRGANGVIKLTTLKE